MSFVCGARGESLSSRQAGNEHDAAGRPAHRRVTMLASGFDGAVRRISVEYTPLGGRGQVEFVTQYDDHDPLSGSAVNGVRYVYDGWGNLTAVRQDHDSKVTASGYWEVAYAYGKADPVAGRWTLRRNSMTLPDGRSVTYTYGSSLADLNARASRVTAVSLGSTVAATYAYLGSGTVVDTVYPEPDVYTRLYSSGGGSGGGEVRPAGSLRPGGRGRVEQGPVDGR